MENWDDLRLFLATARAGSSRGAADELGVNQSTISRRISGLEKRLAVRLFDRNPGGLELTAAGQELLLLSTEVEEGIDALDRRLQGRDLELRGPVRLSLPDVFVAPTAGHLARFAAQYPQIELDVMVDNSVVSLTQREADLALRMAGNPPQQLVGRRIAPVKMAIYGAVDYLSEREQPVDPSTCDWVRWDEEWRGAPPEAWIDANVPKENIRGRVNTTLSQVELMAQGVGLGFKVCYSGDADPRLRRVGEPFDFSFALWLLTHEDLRSTARVRALMRFLGDALAAERHRFLGEPAT